ncbi:MAG TPA: hypothetical protein DEB09_01845 [Candidatus Magasanikbacteria bacterium]|nr:hypothetical protein [Candidatus Magasanikbacteria bacterium]
MTDWNSIRKQFPALKKFTYLNSASESPISIKAAEEGKKYYDTVLYGNVDWDEWCKKIDKVREKVAKLINADKEEIAFIPNTSFGMNFVAQMLRGKGEVVTMDDEFTTTTLPWVNQSFKLNFVKPKNLIYSIEEIDKLVNRKTKILVTSHIQSFTGFKQDLVKLGNYCRSKKLTFVVNATQSIGVTPIDVKKSRIDFLVFSSVKWLNTSEGLGAIYINKKWFNKIKWPMVGWMSIESVRGYDNKNLNLKKNVSVLELGAMNLHSIFVMGKAIELNTSIGIKNIEKRLQELTGYLIDKLKKLNVQILSSLEEKYRSSVVVVKLKNSERIIKELAKKGIVVSLRLSRIRISLNIFNNKKDIDRLVIELNNMKEKGIF